jgi:hypothetical protein
MKIFQAFHDHDKNMFPQYVKSKKEAFALNEKGYGIFGSVNQFHSVRRESDLKRLCYWYCEIDDICKQEQLEKIKQFLVPTIMVESKNGYHCYWAIKIDLIKTYGLENALLVYKEINKRIIKKLSGDTNASDAARVLRLPGFYHCKNPDDKFLVKQVLTLEISYTPQEMLFWLPEESKISKEAKKSTSVNLGARYNSGDFWEKANAINPRDGLEALSGTSYVNGEIFDFIPDRGKFQISVNGQRANCWIDEKGLIGSSSGAGPTIVNWLKYYGHDMKSIAQIIKDVFGISESTSGISLWS